MYQGSPGFMAPEMILTSLQGSPYAVDLWSLGSMAYHMLTGRVVLRDFPELLKYGNGEQRYLSHDYTGLDVTSSAKEFVKKLLARKPADRPKAEEALFSDWMTNIPR